MAGKNSPGEKEKLQSSDGSRDALAAGTGRVLLAALGFTVHAGEILGFWGVFFLMLFACRNNAEGPGDRLDRSPPKLSCPFGPQTQPGEGPRWGIWDF